MKKRVFSGMAIVLFIGSNIACSSDNDDPNMDPEVAIPTYTNHVKPIIDSNCLACHGDPVSNGAPISLVTYTQVKDAAQNHNMINLIESGAMPPSGGLSNSQIRLLKNWISGGYVQ